MESLGDNFSFSSLNMASHSLLLCCCWWKSVVTLMCSPAYGEQLFSCYCDFSDFSTLWPRFVLEWISLALTFSRGKHCLWKLFSITIFISQPLCLQVISFPPFLSLLSDSLSFHTWWCAEWMPWTIFLHIFFSLFLHWFLRNPSSSLWIISASISNVPLNLSNQFFILIISVFKIQNLY